MQTKPKPIIYLSLTSSKLLYPVFYRERERDFLRTKTFVRPFKDNKTFGQAVFPRFEFFSIIRKTNKKRKHTKYNHKSGAKRTNFRLQFW